MIASTSSLLDGEDAFLAVDAAFFIMSTLQEYHKKIAEKVNRYNFPVPCDNNMYYIEKISPFFMGEQIYYEVTFTPATDWHSKSNRLIAFTKIEITGSYASKFHIVSETIDILNTTMPIFIIDGWEVSIRNCEYSNFISLITGERNTVPLREQRVICDFLTNTRYLLSEVMDFPDDFYQQITAGNFLIQIQLMSEFNLM